MNCIAGTTDTISPISPDQTTYEIVPLLKLDKDVVQYYWQTLAMEDTLRFRLSDIENPTWSDVVEMIQRMGASMFMICIGPARSPVAEFMLDNPTGRAVQSHFSTSPYITTKERLAVGRFATRQILTRRTPTGQYNLDALYGLTPRCNRAACIYVLQIGYTRQGILASGMFVNGKPEDCMISVCTRETLR